MDRARTHEGSDAERAEFIATAAYGSRRKVEAIGRVLGLRECDLPDLMQRVVLIMFLRRESIRPGAERAFLSQVTRLEAGHMLRSRRRWRETELEPSLPVTTPAQAEDDVARRRVLRSVANFVATASDGLREVFLAHVIDGQSCHAVAASFGLPVGTVKSRLRRSREAFARVLE